MSSEGAYSGAENLEVMREALNYNAFLLQEVCEKAERGAPVLDFGAGGGQFAAPLASLGFDITALEPDTSLRDRLRSLGIRAVADLDEVTDGSCAFIYSLNVLEHVVDDAGTLRKLFTKLRTGGRLLIYVPAFPILFSSMDAKVGHLRRYKRPTLLRPVSQAGFVIDRAEYVDSLGFFAALTFKFIGGSGDLGRTSIRIYDRIMFPLSRALDALTKRWFGKNLLVVARKPNAS